MVTKACEMNFPLAGTEDEIFEDAREEMKTEWQEVQEPWASKTSSPGSSSKIAVLIALALLVIWLPLTDANTRRCNECYQTVYQTKGNSFQIRHFFRAHTYVPPACYSITMLKKCSEKGHHYWMGKNLNSSQGQCPSDNWLCFNFKYIRSEDDLLKRKPIDADLIQDVVVEEKEKQKEANPLNSHKNLFVDLAERISQQLNLTNCWVCGGTLCRKLGLGVGLALDPPIS